MNTDPVLVIGASTLIFYIIRFIIHRLDKHTENNQGKNNILININFGYAFPVEESYIKVDFSNPTQRELIITHFHLQLPSKKSLVPFEILDKLPLKLTPQAPGSFLINTVNINETLIENNYKKKTKLMAVITDSLGNEFKSKKIKYRF